MQSGPARVGIPRPVASGLRHEGLPDTVAWMSRGKGFAPVLSPQARLLHRWQSMTERAVSMPHGYGCDAIPSSPNASGALRQALSSLAGTGFPDTGTALSGTAAGCYPRPDFPRQAVAWTDGDSSAARRWRARCCP